MVLSCEHCNLSVIVCYCSYGPNSSPTAKYHLLNFVSEPWETSLGHPWDVDVPETSTVRPQDVPSPGTGRPRDCGAGTSAGRSVDVSGTSTETSSVRPWHIQEASLRGGVRGVLRTSEGVSE